MTAFCGDVPHQIPPLEMSEVSDSLQYGGVIESDNLICGGHGGVLWAPFCAEVSIKIMPIKIIVLTEYNPSGSRPNFFGRQHLTFDKGGKNVVLSEG